MKRCKICGADKELDKFHKKSASRDGLMAACKACHYERHKRSVAKCPEKYKQTRDKWKQDNPIRKAQHQVDYRMRNAAQVKERRRIMADRDRYDPNTRPKVLARQRVKSAIRRGTMTRQPCQVCGATENIHAHHEDYSKPLDVTWLCHPCHVERHGGKPLARLSSQVRPPKESFYGIGNG